MVIVAFKPGEKEISKYEELDQYDYGQILRIQGLNLPPAVEIHFALQKTGGTSKNRIGITKDGVTDVPIPDSMLENGDTEDDYSIYAFIYITDETSGQTEYRITLRVKARPKPEVPGGGDNPDIFHEVMETVRKAMEAAAESERQAEGWAHGREDLPERAQDNAKYYSDQAREDSMKTDADRKEVGRLVESVSGIGEQVEKVEGLTKQAQTSATNAALSEQAAKESENNAAQARAGAEVAEDNAELAAQRAEQDKAIVEQAKNLVKQMGQEVLDNKNLVDETAQDFNLKAQQALADVNNAGQTQTERVQSAGTTAVENIQTTQDTATEAVETAKSEAIQAIQAEGTTQTGNVTTEGTKQVQAVADKGKEVLQSIPEDFQIQMGTKLDKNQGAENAGKALVVGEDGNVKPGEVQGEVLKKQMELIESYAIEQSDTGFEIPIGSEYKDVLVEIKIKPREVAALRMKFDSQEVMFVTTGSYLGGSTLLQLFMHNYGGYADGWLKKISYETQISTNSFNSMKIKGMPNTITLTPWKSPSVIGVEAATAYVYAR